MTPVILMLTKKLKSDLHCFHLKSGEVLSFVLVSGFLSVLYVVLSAGDVINICALLITICEYGLN